MKSPEAIEKSGNRLLNLINNILDVSKIEANLMKTNFIETNINECLDDLYSFFNPEAVKKNIRFSYQKELPDTKALISTDAEKLNAILINLIKNALKYTDEGFIEFGYKLNSDSNYIEFYVEDSGIGILKNKQEAIFERFIQADINDKHAKEGIGLGLAICKAYVFMLGGEIRLNSSINKGTRFYFTIPFLNIKGINCNFETVSNEKN